MNYIKQIFWQLYRNIFKMYYYHMQDFIQLKINFHDKNYQETHILEVTDEQKLNIVTVTV